MSSKLCLDDNEHFYRCVLSFSQDIMFHATQSVPPKHIVLRMTLHHLFRSKKLITLLNSFGDTIAYSQVLEWETALAERKMHDEVCIDELPACIDRSKPFSHVVDNNDLNEEARTDWYGNGALFK